ncbi:MAG: hypothetical protein LBP39_03915, partial [Rickettsiales bacterium]|nr:hypothetical protein [Rickettsiales bacterium]
MKINKKINYSRIAVSYLFLGTLAIFIGLGAGTCLANTVDVNSSSELEKAIGSNISTINIKADSITLGQKLPVINRSLVIYGKTNGSILDGNNAHKILEFSQNLNNITINNTHFQRGHNEDPLDEYSGGGAAHIKKGKTILFNNTNFSNNTAVSQGGAILSLGDNSRKNSLLFNGRTTFTSNESTSGAGGAMAVWNSDLTFGGEVEFTNNKSIVGGAIYSLGDGPHKNIILFKGKTTFTGNKSIDNESIKGYGGAMFIENSDLTFGGEAEFENNKSNKDGGAIFSKGDAQNKNTLLFNGKATFNGNKSTSDRGGAIFAQDSDLTFDGKTKFENNTSKESGGAIFSMGNAQNKNILLFSREAIFTGNKSTG